MPLNISPEAATDSLNIFFLNPQNRDVLIHNVNVINYQDGSITASSDVLISNKQIQKVASAGSISSAEALVVDASGKYLSPGYSDMHAHVYPSFNLSNDLFLFLAKGITTVRIMWGSSYHVSLRDSIKNGLKVGPLLYVASGGFDGTAQVWPGAVITKSTVDIKRAIDDFKEKGFDYIKVYSSLPRDQYLELVNYAWEKGIPPIGHVPTSVDAYEAVAVRQYSIEHFSQVGASPYGSQAVFAESINNDVFFCPTLTILNRVIGSIPSYKTDWFELVSPEGQGFFERTRGQIPANNSFFLKNVELFKKLTSTGGKIISGTDTGIRYVLPGPSLHEEFLYYTQNGMTPVEALRTTTINVADYLNDTKVGVIEEGALANLVLLNANPLTDIRNTEQIAGVVTNGQWISSDKISYILQLIRASYKGK